MGAVQLICCRWDFSDAFHPYFSQRKEKKSAEVEGEISADVAEVSWVGGSLIFSLSHED